MIPSNIPFVVFSSCIPVKGGLRSAICDLQRYKVYYIPNVLYDLICDNNGESIQHIKSKIDPKNHKYIDEYFEFLVKEELVFFTETPNLFPDLNMDWKSPSRITNAIIDIADFTQIPWEEIVDCLDDLGCKFLQIRFFVHTDLAVVRDIFRFFEAKIIESIDIYLPFDPLVDSKEYINFINSNSRLSTLYLFGHEQNELFYSALYNAGYIYFVKDTINSRVHCGKIFPKKLF